MFQSKWTEWIGSVAGALDIQLKRNLGPLTWFDGIGMSIHQS